MQKTTIVVPCYNEAKRLNAAAFLKALDAWPWLHLLFIDDGSADATLPMLREIREARSSRVSVTGLLANRGKAEAVRSGMLEALETDAELIGYWDADLAAPLSELDAMRLIMMERDALMVLGSRVRLLGKSISRTAPRHYLGRAFATAASLVLGLSVYDTQCGAKLLKNCETIKEVFKTPFESRWIFDVEILARLLILERGGSERFVETRIIEHPLQNWHHVQGSRLTPRDYQRALLDLAAIAGKLHLKI